MYGLTAVDQLFAADRTPAFDSRGPLRATVSLYRVCWVAVIIVLAFAALGYLFASALLLPRHGWIWPLLMLLSWILVNVWLWAAATLYLLGAALSVPTSFREALYETAGWPTWRVGWTNMLVGLATMLGLICFVAPGIWIYLRYGVLAMPVAVGEQLSGVAAMRRAYVLSSGHTWFLLRQGLWMLIVVFGGTAVFGLIEGALAAVPIRLLTALGIAVLQPLVLIWSVRCFVGLASGIGYNAAIAAPPRIGLVGQCAAVLALVLGLVVSSERILTQAFWVPAGSMIPTLLVGDHFMVDNAAYGIRLPLLGTRVWRQDLKRGDLAVFVSPVDGGTSLIKRVVAIAGDTIEIRNKQPLIEGMPITEPYAHIEDPRIAEGPRDNYGPAIVPHGKFFVLGDNRDRSYDSRFWGFADEEQVIGRVGWIYWSWDSERKRPRFERIGLWVE